MLDYWPRIVYNAVMVKEQMTKEQRRSRARTLVASAYVCARKAGRLMGQERGAMRNVGLQLFNDAQRIYRLPLETELAVKCALYPDDTRTAAQLANVRARKFGYTEKPHAVKIIWG